MIEVGPAAEPPRRTERASAAEEQTSVYGGTQGIPEWQARKMTAAPKVGLSERRKDVVKAQIEPGTAAFKIDRAFQAVGNRQGRHISLKLYDVRKESGLDRETFDRALNQMRSEGVFSLDSNEGLHNKLTKEEYQAGIPYMGASEHEIFLPFISRRDD